MHGCFGYCIYHQKRQTRAKDNANESKTGKSKFSDSVSDDNTNGKKQHKRLCIFGAGHEENDGKGDKSYNYARGQWVYTTPCILRYNKLNMHGSNISLSVTGLERECGCKTFVLPIGSK
jgi:hypothetical protein